MAFVSFVSIGNPSLISAAVSFSDDADKELEAIIKQKDSSALSRSQQKQVRPSSPFEPSERKSKASDSSDDSAAASSQDVGARVIPKRIAQDDLNAPVIFLQRIISLKPATLKQAEAIFTELAGKCENSSQIQIAWLALSEEVESLIKLKEKGHKLQEDPTSSYNMPLHLLLLNVPRMIERAAQTLLEDMPTTQAIEMLGQRDEFSDEYMAALCMRDLAREERLGIPEMEMAEERIAIIREIAESIFQDELGKLVVELNQLEAKKAVRSEHSSQRSVEVSMIATVQMPSNHGKGQQGNPDSL